MQDLARRWREGDERAGDELARRLRPMVAALAKPYITAYCPSADLVQEGIIAAMMQGPSDYDPTRGKSFSSWACSKAVSAMRHYRRDRGDIIRRPAYAQEAGVPAAILLPLPLPVALRQYERVEDSTYALVDSMAARQRAERYLGWTGGMARDVLRLGWLGYDDQEIGRRIGRTARQVQHYRGSAQRRMRARAQKVGEKLII